MDMSLSSLDIIFKNESMYWKGTIIFFSFSDYFSLEMFEKPFSPYPYKSSAEKNKQKKKCSNSGNKMPIYI